MRYETKLKHRVDSGKATEKLSFVTLARDRRAKLSFLKGNELQVNSLICLKSFKYCLGGQRMM